MANVMALGSAWLPASLSSNEEGGVGRSRLPHRKWKTWLSTLDELPAPPWHMELVVGLMHWRSRSHASFMMPREHSGRPEGGSEVRGYNSWPLIQSINQSNVVIKPFQHPQLSQSALQKLGLDLSFHLLLCLTVLPGLIVRSYLVSDLVPILFLKEFLDWPADGFLLPKVNLLCSTFGLSRESVDEVDFL